MLHGMISPHAGVVVVYGSPDSTDIDVVLFVFEMCNLDREHPDEHAISELLAPLGYATSRRIDCNIAIVKNGDIISTSRRNCKDVQNRVYYTWQYHAQLVDKLPIDRPIPIEEFTLRDRLDALTDWVYLGINGSLTGTSLDRIEFVMEVMPIIMRDPMDKLWHNIMKSLVMYLVQLLIHKHGLIEHNKMNMPMYGDIIGINPEYIRWYLTRGHDGVFSHIALYQMMWQYYEYGLEEYCKN